MSGRSRAVVIGMLLMVMAILHSGCFPERDGLVLCAVADRTGPIALYGNWAIEGMTLAVEDFNADRAIGNRLRLVLEDGQSSPQVGVTVFRRIVSRFHPAAVVVATGSGSIMACAPVANEKQIVLFTPTASGPSITEAGDFVFRNRVSGFSEASEMAQVARKRLHLRRMSVVAINNDAGPGYISAFKNAFESEGGVVSGSLLLDPGKSDYRTQVLKVRRFAPEGVFLGLTVKEAALFIKQSAEVGFHPKWTSMTTIQSDELFKVAGGEAEGLLFVAEGGDDGNPRFREFAARFEKRFGRPPSMNALNGYDAVRLLAPLLSQPGCDGTRVRDALYGTKGFQGVGGMLTFDKNGDAKKSLKLLVARSGRFVELR